MKLQSVEIENYRAIEEISLQLDPRLTVLHGENAHGKTSLLRAIAVGLGAIPSLLPGVGGVGFQKTDRRQWRSLEVRIETTNGVAWRRTKRREDQQHVLRNRRPALRELRESIEKIVRADREEARPLDLPIVAFYDTDRAVLDQPQRRTGIKAEFPRYAALQGALSAKTDFKEFLKWFYAKEHEEFREQRQRKNLGFQLEQLNAVRRAIESMVPGATDPRIETSPLRFVVSVRSVRGEPEVLSLGMLSGGYRVVLALAADLARRMAQGNPHLDNALTSEAIVLIDEVDLHLHPSWQQRVLDDLSRTFPNTQFIVSTHSPQVLTTVKPENIVTLGREDGKIVAQQASAATFGAEAGDVLSILMGVDERPRNEFVRNLEKYIRLVGRGLGESEKALSLRQKLESLSPSDSSLDRADIEIRRRKLLKSMGKS